jgi:protein ImuA
MIEHIMNKSQKLAELRRFMAPRLSQAERVALGHAGIDAALGGGLQTGALHEVYAGDWGAGGFAALLALKTAGRAFHGKGGPLFWVRPDYEALEYGALSPAGLLELGGDPARLVLVRTPDVPAALAAAQEIAANPHAGALLLALEGTAPRLDLNAGRRLVLAAERSGVSLILLREGAKPRPSAAETRWQVRSLSSSPADDDWGAPVLEAALVRNRSGALGCWHLAWDRTNGIFRQYRAAASAGAVAAAAADRPAPAQRHA